MAAALDEVLEWGVEVIQAYTGSLTAEIAGRARDLGFWSEEPHGRAGHIVGLRAPASTDPGRLARRLEAGRISVSLRGDALRVAPHLYNDLADTEALIEALRDVTA
jgi:selenocysteine lyase/cysteine desulfurase